MTYGGSYISGSGGGGGGGGEPASVQNNENMTSIDQPYRHLF